MGWNSSGSEAEEGPMERRGKRLASTSLVCLGNAQGMGDGGVGQPSPRRG